MTTVHGSGTTRLITNESPRELIDLYKSNPVFCRVVRYHEMAGSDYKTMLEDAVVSLAMAAESANQSVASYVKRYGTIGDCQPTSAEPIGDGEGVFVRGQQGYFFVSGNDKLADDLARKYHEQTEAFDRGVCSGPIVRGEVQPRTPYERSVIVRNARKVFDDIMAEAAQYGMDENTLREAIKHNSRSGE